MKANNGFIAVTMDSGIRNDREHDFLNREYTDFITGLGHIPLLLPNTHAAIEILCKIPVKGIIFSGGCDIGLDYASLKKDQAEEISQARDDQESGILDFAVENKIPILGICRGMQFINVRFGGDLISDLSSISTECVIAHYRNEHEMIFTKENERIRINSFHHQGFTEAMTAPDLEILAISSGDGVVESVRHNHLPILAVQWHPERPNGGMEWLNEKIQKLFE